MPPEEIGGQEETDPDNGVVPRAAKCDQPDAAAEQHHTDQREHDGGKASHPTLRNYYVSLFD